MAVACTLLASGGFVGAGYVGTSTADAAAALSIQQASRTSAISGEVEPAGFDSVAAQGLGAGISFGNTLISAKKPAAKTVFDLTDPNGNTPHLARGVSAMRGDIPEVSAELISQVRKDILAAAYQGLGHPYVWGGTSFENGWDCSGFVQWAYAQAGVVLPRTEQWMPMVETSNPQPGDIVVQNPDGPNHWSHIGIYIGNGKMISALNPSVGTFIHAPGDVSSSSSYFTMPAFAAADAKAKADAEAAKTSAAASSAATTPGKTSGPATPGTTPPATTAPATVPTKPPVTTPPTKPPATTPPVTTVPPVTPPPVTTPPVIAPPVTTPPVTTVPPASSEPPVTVEPRSEPPVTVDSTTVAPSGTGLAVSQSATASTQPGTDTPTP